MKPWIVFAVVLTLLCALQIIPPAALAQQSLTDFMYGGCNTGNFISNDSFSRNLDAVVKSLMQNSSKFLYSLASSETGNQSNVYGVYQCRGDISLSQCTSCVNYLTLLQTTNSSNPCGGLVIGARFQLIGCYFRYENYKFYTGFEKDGVFNFPPKCSGSINDSSQPLLYEQNLATALEDSATAAPQHALFGYNASSAGSGSNAAYALTQCYGYLNSSECSTCLSQVSNFNTTCDRSAAGQVFLDGCYYLFGNSSLVFTGNNSLPSANPPNSAIAIPAPEKSKDHTATIVGIVVGVCALVAVIIVAVYFLNSRKKSVKSAAENYKAEDPLTRAGEQLLTKPGAKRFSLKKLQDATDNFHPSNKLGEGGFGPVYQGRLKSGIEVAIKMLSAQSHQGKIEFFNEVNLITTVQHRNLIQLIGCCVEDNKPLLVYEYLPNRSLDLHLFDVDENNALDWHTRFDLTIGIARGLKYLHEESPVRIIHRDIKASNILLDNQLNPKIADFGLARLFADDRTHLTTRVVGTLGYLSPEYAISGQLTEKADVYSFGLVALEIVSGRRVVENKFEDDKQNLLDWTWSLYEKQQQLQILDKRIKKTGKSSSTNVTMQVNVGEVIRVVHVALLCTQMQPQARPSMSEVHNMLCGKSEILNLPTKPITVGMLTPIPNLLHDGSSSMLYSSGTNMPSWTSQPSYSYDGGPISQVEPR